MIVENRNLLNGYFAWEEAYDLKHISSNLQMTNFTFGVFAGDLFREQSLGGRLVVCPKEVLIDPEKLFELIEKKKVEYAEFVLAVLRFLLKHIGKLGRKLYFMKILCCASDKWYTNEAIEFLKFYGEDNRLINSFGVTEANIDSSYFEFNNHDLKNHKLTNNVPVPIGKPFANNKVYILVTDMNPVTEVIPGEFYIGGVCVARGYLKNYALTKKKFISNPFLKDPGEGLYKTGDQAKYLPDGNIEFIGRLDNYMKIRGFRIELGEIESVLLNHPGVKKNVVIVVDDANYNKKIIVYVVSYPSSHPLERGWATIIFIL